MRTLIGLIGLTALAVLLGPIVYGIYQMVRAARLEAVNRELDQAFGKREGHGDLEEEDTQQFRRSDVLGDL